MVAISIVFPAIEVTLPLDECKREGPTRSTQTVLHLHFRPRVEIVVEILVVIGWIVSFELGREVVRGAREWWSAAEKIESGRVVTREGQPVAERRRVGQDSRVSGSKGSVRVAVVVIVANRERHAQDDDESDDKEHPDAETPAPVETGSLVPATTGSGTKGSSIIVQRFEAMVSWCMCAFRQ